MPDQLPVELPGLGAQQVINFRRIPSGSFRMGARGRFHFEEPVHRVVIEAPFYLAEFPTTQAQFAVWTKSRAYRDWFAANQEIIRETSPQKAAEPHRNHFADDSLRPRNPAECVTWWEARAYADWLTRSGLLPVGWRAELPSETQWEYACRAGTESAYWNGDREQDLAHVGWYAENSGGETQPVGQKTANAWGLHDMHGNVWEWCLDYYDARGYRKRVESQAGFVLDEAQEVEPEGADPLFVALAEMMERFSSDEEQSRRVLPSDRESLETLQGWVESFPETDSWKQAGVDVAAKQALKRGYEQWPDADMASALRPIFQGWVDMAESSDLSARVLRGGACGYTAAHCRAAYRNGNAPGDRDGGSGFRLALVPGPVSVSERASEAEPRVAGKARRDAAAEPRREGGAAGQSADRLSHEIRAARESDGMSRVKSNRDGQEKAISSIDGKKWWGGAVPFPFPPAHAPDASVKRLVLGSLEDGEQLTLDEQTLTGLRRLRDHFPGLTHLHLWGLSNLREVDGLPDQLECLDVRKCPALETIGPLPETARLKTLDLGDCPAIRALPSGPLNDLEYVWLDGCRGLRQFAPLHAGLNSIKHLELHGCRFDDLDAAYCGLAGENVVEKVCSRYRAGADQGTEPLAECKVIVLGNGGVGKTELVRALKGLAFHPEQDATDGIRLWKWDGDGCAPFPESGVDKLDVNIWDFGGQDLYHNTHRLFLESRAVFVVVEREKPKGKPFRPDHPEDVVRPLDYWLDQVHAANPEARVIVVRTGIDISEGVEPLEPWRNRVRPDYHGLDYFEVSSKVREDMGQWPQLRERLLALVRAELGGPEAVQVPKGRAAVRRRLAEWQPSWDEGDDSPDSPRPVLRRHEFVELARDTFRDAGLPAPTADEIRWQLDYFHYSGAVYAPPKWMEEARSPEAYPVIVDQRWVIEGIYELIVSGRDARDIIIASNGIVRTDDLEEAWGSVCNQNDEPRYDKQAQWVMQKYMKSCGLLIEWSDGMVMPEFLPPLKRLKRRSNDPLVAAIHAGTPSRTYAITHRTLGQGVGCLLVGLMARHFGVVPLFRYGAIAEVKLGNAYTGSEQDVPVLVQWTRQHEDSFQGDVCVTIFGPQECDGDVLEFLGGLIRSIPGFPRDAPFEVLDGMPPAAPPVPHKMHSESMPVRVRAKPRLGNVGLSIAGEDEANPGIEFWPRAIERGLKTISDRNFEVLFYKRDVERCTLPELIQDLSQSDLMIAVVGAKYLRSKYCMVEFLKAARWWSWQLSAEEPRHENDDGWLGDPSWQAIEERLDTSTSADRQFIWGPLYIDHLILRDRDTDANGTLDQRLYALQDANWNVTALTNTAGDAVERYVYDAYGTPTVLTGAFGNRTDSDYDWESFFTGQRLDVANRLHLFRRRYQNSNLGDFLTRDSLKYFDSFNLYEYASSSPNDRVDLSGQQAGLKPFGSTLASQCQKYLLEFATWYQKEKSKGTAWLLPLPDCPCTLKCWTVKHWRGIQIACYRMIGYEWEEFRCANPNIKVWHDPVSGAEVGIWHPGASVCIRSKPLANGSGQQCCYDANGMLITSGQGAGTPDYVSPDNAGHVTVDVEPYNIAVFLDKYCTSFPQYVDMYLEVRPPNQGRDATGKPCPSNPTPGKPRKR